MNEEKQKNGINPQTGVKNALKAKVKRDISVFGSARALCFAAMLAAMSLILGKFLQIPNPLQEIIRISFENLPIILSGITMGPFVGAMTGAVADLLGCALYGYAINPVVTLGAVTVGFVSGAVAHYLFRRRSILQVVVATALSHLLGSVLVKSLGLAAWYLSSYQMGLAQLMLWRLLTYAVIAVAEGTILCLFLKNKAFAAQIERVRKK